MPKENVTYIISLQDKFSKRLDNIRKNTTKLDGTVNNLNSSIVRLGGAFAALQLGKKIFNIGVEFEQTEIAFQSMLGSVEKGTKLFNELIQFSKDTPFLSKEVTTLSKRLMAQGVAAENLLETMTLLGNMSSALGKDKLPQLVLAFGQVKAATFLRGQELRQFEEAGVNLKKLLATELNVEIKEVTDLVSKQTVSFTMVEKALNNLAGPTGEWGDMMEKLMASTGGKFMVLMSNLEIKAREISQKGFPLLNKGLDFLNNNFDRLVSALGKAIKIFALYKGGVIATNVAMRVFAKGQAIVKLTTLAFSRGLKGAILVMKSFKASMISTGVGALAVGVGFLIEKLITWRNRTKDQVDAQRKLNNELDRTNELLFREFLKKQGVLTRQGGLEIFDFDPKKITKLIESTTLEGLSRMRSVIEIQMKEVIREIDKITDKTKKAGTPEFVVQNLLRNPEARLRGFKRVLATINNELDRTERSAQEKGLMAQKAGITDIKAAAPRVFNINIEKLVETINNNVTNLKEGMSETKEVVTRALLDALNQTQLTALQ